MKTQPIPYEKQIFVCTNDRKGESCSCGDNKGAEVFRHLRNLAKERKLHPRIRIAQATCLGQCNSGVNVMVYPDNEWFSRVTLENCDEIAQKYL